LGIFDFLQAVMFGFVYLWYLMTVLLLEIWFEYRRKTQGIIDP